MSPATSTTRTAGAGSTGTAGASAVLVVGDRSASSSRAIAACLRAGGHAVAEIDAADPAVVDAAALAELLVLDASALDADVAHAAADAARSAYVPVLSVAAETRDLAAAKADARVAHPAAEEELLATAGTLLRLRRAERELRRKTARLRETQAATADLARAGSFDAVARALHLHAASALGASIAVLYRLGDPRQAEDTTTLHAPAIERHGGLASAAESCRELPLHRDTAVTQAVRFGEAVWVADASAQGAPARLVLHDAELGSWAALPLLTGERAFGCLAVGWPRPQPGGAFDPADIVFLHGLAVQAAISLERAQFAETEREERRRTERLQHLTEALSEARTVEEVADAAVVHGSTAFGAVGTVIAMLLPDGQTVELVKARDMTDEAFETWRRFPLSVHGPLSDAIRTAQPVFLRSLEDWEKHYPQMVALATAQGHHANAVLPLIVDRRAVGAMGMAFDTPRTFRDATDTMLVAARQCALALERARLFEAERLARAEAEAANRAKSDFLAVMSHELRTPLNAIGGYVELLELGVHGPVTDAQREDYLRIQAAQRHLIGLINDVLNYVRIETGRVQYVLADVPLHETLFALHALFAPQLHAKGLAYTYAGTDPSVTVRADRDKLNQILLNLLTNAIKFTDPGGHITLETSVAADRVMVCVRDTGLGIPADQLEAIFEPFVQVDKRLTRTNEGVGLGLSISRDLARGMGGDLAAESTPGVGSAMTLTLPRA